MLSGFFIAPVRESPCFKKGTITLFLTKKIFCPTEFSKPARSGVDAAVEMDEKFSTEPILVHVIPLRPWRSDSFQRATNKERQTAYAHEAMVRLIKESVPSQIKCRSQIIGGMLIRPADAIVQLAEEESGPDGVSQPWSIRLGSNILRLRDRECSVPVNLPGVDAKTPELDLNEKMLLY